MTINAVLLMGASAARITMNTVVLMSVSAAILTLGLRVMHWRR